MTHYQLFPLLLLACSVAAFVLGGAPERAMAGMLLAGVIATFFSARAAPVRFHGTEWGIAFVDLLLLLGFLGVALSSTRYWPLAMTAIQFLGFSAHFLALTPGTDKLVYAMAVDLMSYPMLLTLAAGTARHWMRVRRYGPEISWVSSSSPSPAAMRGHLPIR